MKQRIVSILLTLAMCLSLLPVTAWAAGGDKTIMLGTSGISGYDGTNGYDYIYYGEWDNSPIKWRVLDEQTNTQNEGLFLLSDVLLGTGTYGGVYFDNSGSDSNVWQNSTAQTWCKNFYSNNFSSKEQNAVLATAKSDSAYTSTSFGYAYGVSSLSGDKVFFLSAEEAENSAYGFTDDNARIANYGNSAGYWWLRSPYAFISYYAGLVSNYGYVNYYSVFDDWAARPAFNLDLNSVLFISAAEGGKISAAASGGNQGAVGADAIFEIGNNTGSEWKLTLLDSSRNFSISDAAINSSGDTMAFSYSNAQTGTNEYISVVIEDNGAITHYGRILQLDGTTGSASGTASLTLPAGVTLDNDTKLYVFNEQYNGGEKDDTKRTDYGSKLIKVNPTVDNTAPALSDGTATRDSETAATVKFISDEAGTCYYIAQDTEITLTNAEIAAQGTKQACSAGENEIKLDNISASAQYVAIVAQDAVGNVSQPLKISIPAYIAPSYGISASPAALNFGSKTVDYTEAPAAQTVTLTNTGNQNVTVNLPTSTNYIITGGEGFTNDTATLAPNGTAAFTVQPNTGLTAGDYDETLTVSGGSDVSASIELSFEVLETYTLTVDLNGGSGSTIGGEYPAGEVVNIDAGSRSNYRFIEWTSSNGGTFGDASSASTTFTMPAADTTITANWRYIGGGGTTPSNPTKTPSQRAVDKIKDARDGSTVEITLPAGQTTLDKEVFETLAGRDVTLEVSVPGGVTWTVNGQDIPRNAALTDIDMGVSMGTSTIPVSVINALTGEVSTVQFTLTHDGPFGFTMTLTAPVGAENAGYWANLYYYNEGSRALEFQAADRIAADGTASFPFSHASQYAIVIDTDSHEPVELPFTDVPEGAWYEDAAAYVYKHGLMAGTSATTFAPEVTTSRAMIATILWRMAGSPVVNYAMDYTDVAQGQWCSEAIRWATSEGVVTGYGNGLFGTNDPITRQQFAAMLWRYAQAQGYDVSIGEDTNILSYTDVANLSEYAIPAMQWAVGAGIINGTSADTLTPQGRATRAQAAVMLMRFCEEAVTW